MYKVFISDFIHHTDTKSHTTQPCLQRTIHELHSIKIALVLECRSSVPRSKKKQYFSKILPQPTPTHVMAVAKCRNCDLLELDIVLSPKTFKPFFAPRLLRTSDNDIAYQSTRVSNFKDLKQSWTSLTSWACGGQGAFYSKEFQFLDLISHPEAWEIHRHTATNRSFQRRIL